LTRRPRTLAREPSRYLRPEVVRLRVDQAEQRRERVAALLASVGISDGLSAVPTAPSRIVVVSRRRRSLTLGVLLGGLDDLIDLRLGSHFVG
jgi:hypothetical protein